jgi:hypothetical protein
VPARQLGTVEIADIHFAMMQNWFAAGVDQQRRIERLRLGRF